MLPRLIATDLDGTLLDHERRITPRTVAAVRAVVAAGTEFVLVTARPPRTVAPLAAQLGGRIAALCGNGTMLAEFDAARDGAADDGAAGDRAASDRTAGIGAAGNGAAGDSSASEGAAGDGAAGDSSASEGAAGDGAAGDSSASEGAAGNGSAGDGSASDGAAGRIGEVTFIRAFKPADAIEIVEQLRPLFPDAGFAIETGHEVYFEAGFGVGSVDDRHRILTDSLTGVAPQMPSIVKVLARSPLRTADDMVAAANATLTVDAEVSHSGGRGLLEIAPLGASKASALEWLCALRGISAGDVAAFGDMPNDLPMLRWAGRSYAMANAHLDVLAAADHVVGHHAEEGVALALEALLG
jgi:hydroxymethylpyrimidine pyrophosphatase-like HAD family hydrolase